MQRREFVNVAGGAIGAIAGSMLACMPGARGRAPSASPVPLASPLPLDATAFHAARRFVETPFGRIAYVERGHGAAAIFLHGFPLNGFQWRGAIERLSTHRRCVAPDFLAMGHTAVALGQSVAPDAQAAMIVALMDRLGIEAADVVASDSGGAVAQLLVARSGARVRSLLLTNCDTEIDSPPPALLPVIELSKAGRWVDEWLAPWLADKELARSAKGIGGLCYVDRSHPTDEAIEMYFAPLVRSAERKTLAHAYAIALERNPLAGVERSLRESRVPVRVLWGTADDIFSAESPGYLDRTFGDSRGVRRLAGRKLFWPEELPDVVAEEARALWGIRSES
jgi:pimeloyl-ACP methyl ester carboxylesterase